MVHQNGHNTRRVSVVINDTAAIVAVSGNWTVRDASDINADLYDLLPTAETVEFLLEGVDDMDTAGAWILHKHISRLRKLGVQTSVSGLKGEYFTLLDEVKSADKGEMKADPQINPIARLFHDIIKAIARIGEDFILLLNFLGSTFFSLLKVLLKPKTLRVTAFIHHVEHVGLRAVPIVALICFLIGAVMMQQGIVQLAWYGAEIYAINMVGVLSMREVGVLLSAIMVAGRSGSAFTAEIGSMKMREEIDAMRMLGIDPVVTLVLPRVLALLIVVPILGFIGGIMCLVGGGMMAGIYLDLTPSAYIEQLQGVITMEHFMAGMLKAPIIALIIGLVGSLEGMRVKGSAESLGKHVTRSVVKAIFLVIIMDALFAMFLAAIGI
jgi:phospholipid/cholesterol/gamma-HCH transport system permease protein